MKVERNFDFFMAGKSEGLTQAGMGRLNQSNEAFVYCILGAQVTIRSSILGSSGSATEVQHEFLILVEDPIRTPEISTSVQRFQLATDEAKVGLDLALSPSHLEIKLLEPDAKAKARSFSSPANSKPASIPLLDIVRSRSNAGKSQCQLDHNTRTLNPQEWPHLHVPFGIFMQRFLYQLPNKPRHFSPSPELLADLHWWQHFLLACHGVSFLRSSPWIDEISHFCTEASLAGIGGFLYGHFFHSTFPPFIAVTSVSIASLEMLAVTVSFKL